MTFESETFKAATRLAGEARAALDAAAKDVGGAHSIVEEGLAALAHAARKPLRGTQDYPLLQSPVARNAVIESSPNVVAFTRKPAALEKTLDAGMNEATLVAKSAGRDQTLASRMLPLEGPPRTMFAMPQLGMSTDKELIGVPASKGRIIFNDDGSVFKLQIPKSLNLQERLGIVLTALHAQLIATDTRAMMAANRTAFRPGSAIVQLTEVTDQTRQAAAIGSRAYILGDQQTWNGYSAFLKKQHNHPIPLSLMSEQYADNVLRHMGAGKIKDINIDLV